VCSQMEHSQPRAVTISANSNSRNQEILICEKCGEIKSVHTTTGVMELLSATGEEVESGQERGLVKTSMNSELLSNAELRQ
jgi:Fe2+ or Zn2+ uptake regulation protein